MDRLPPFPSPRPNSVCNSTIRLFSATPTKGELQATVAALCERRTSPQDDRDGWTCVRSDMPEGWRSNQRVPALFLKWVGTANAIG